MADYKETTISGNSWTRCKKIEIFNSYNKTPYIYFHEETRMNVNDEIIGVPKDYILTKFQPENIIELRNPETMEKTGDTITQLDLYTILYSAYIQEALKRDEKNAPPEIPEPLPEDGVLPEDEIGDI